MDFVLAAFGTFLGAAVALAAERMSRWRDARLREEAALNNLILDLAAKRAFVVSPSTWTWGDGEVQRVRDSVLSTRELIRDARMSLRPRSDALQHLRQLTVACNRYLQVDESGDDLRKQVALRELSARLVQIVRALHASNPGRLVNDVPGQSSLSA